MNWENLIQNLGIFTLISAMIGYLIQSSIKLLFDRNMHQFKTKANLEIEKFKAEIQLESEKNKMQYAILQEKRALVIEKFYSLLMKFDKSAKDLMALFQPAGTLPEHEKAKITASDANTFLDYYNEHRIYFDESTCKLIDDINEKFRKAWIDFQFKDEIKREKAEDDLWLKSWKTITEEIPAIRREVESNFREILGIK